MTLDVFAWISALWQRGCFGKILALLLSLVFAVTVVVWGAIIVFGLSGGYESAGTEEEAKPNITLATPSFEVTTENTELLPTSVPLVMTAPPPVVTPESLEQNISLHLELPNRDVAEPLRVEKILDVVNVQWALSDNLTMNLMRGASLGQATEILRAIHDFGTDYRLINLTGTFALVDGFGNSREGPVLWITMSSETMSKINWADEQWVEFVFYQRLPEIADSIKFSPVWERE